MSMDSNLSPHASLLFVLRACSSTVEQSAHNALVVGSNPTGPII